jgi:hypothetical protein
MFYWTEESAQNVSIDLLPLLSILRGMSVYLSLSTDRQQRRQSATAQADRQQHRQSAGAVQHVFWVPII